ncbi:YhcN/YlaJ family sporulation lipoprotein [Neobacillus sp. OS1-2]|uniref:YhcN/YlaJ family sporulation lipoprotein n=1 Tax=Neobacillus sp. OS1-2 TaxID=3070680 RepID=UPI0027DEC380|nr:YhcN/YlaJ family sporulation lipoprotein [Neobacillus sp. OS1-2]WML39549.1 YhcN/YlaJ family sporulation lipoprotein [Neobacillus sp. OS1-2]
MKKKSLVPFVLATALIGLTGCADRNDHAVDTNRDNMGVDVRNDADNGVGVRNVRNDLNNGLQNGSNQRLHVSTKAGRNVENLQEVDLAHVIIRNNDAYVAVKLKNNNGATRTTNNTGTNRLNRTNKDAYPNNTNGRGATIEENVNDGVRGIVNNGIPETRGNGNGTNDTIGSDGTNNITGSDGTLNGNNANFKKATSGLDKKIAKQVRAAVNNIDHVYVSYDQTFFKQMTNYSNDITNGRNRDGLWDDFTNSMNRSFR